MVWTFVTVDDLQDGVLRLGGAPARHLGGALRLRPGETLVAVTPDGFEHVCTVRSASPTSVEAVVGESRRAAGEPSIEVRVAVGLLKGDQLERLIEYCSEAGATSFQPVLAERSIVRLEGPKLEQRLRRWREIARSGAELGRRGRVPEVLTPTDLPQTIAEATAAGLRPLLLYEGTGLGSLSDTPLERAGCCLLVGPEGGWSEPEVAAASAAGAEAVTLGPRIMRPLPAALTALAVVLHRAGQLTLGKEAS